MGGLSFIEDGAEFWRDAVPLGDIATLADEIERCSIVTDRGGLRAATTHLPMARTISRNPILMARTKVLAGQDAKLVRAILFDKSAERNWLVSWHQDRLVAVSDRFDAPEWTHWSMKSGLIHAQPPLELLENMVTLRLHLDDTGTHNGCLKIIPGSHTSGILDRQTINHHTATTEAVDCTAQKGDILVMRPLILHASSRMAEGSHRRILHLEYSAHPLPPGISWAA